MKRLRFVLLLLSVLAFAAGYQSYLTKTFTATGTSISIRQLGTIGYHQISWTKTGTVTGCTIAVDSSPDNSTWTAGGIITGQTCTTNGQSAVTAASANYIRLNMTAFTGTGSVLIVYKGYVNNPSGSGSSFYQTVQSAGTPLTQQPALNFGTGFTCSNDGANNRTDCTVTPSGGSVPNPGANGLVNCTGTACSTSAVVTAPSGAIVGTTDVQALTHKDLTDATNTFPTLNQNTTGTAANLSGTQTQNQVYASPNGSSGVGGFRALVAADVPTLNQNTTGSAAKWTTARALAGNNVDGSAAVPFANKFLVQGTADAGLSGAQFLGALGTGLMKNTSTTGVVSIATAADVDTLYTGTGKCYLFKGTSPGSNDGCDTPPGAAAGSQYAVQYSSDGIGTFAGVTVPSANGDYVIRYHVVSSAAVAPTAVQVGVGSRSITGSSTTALVAFGDANNLLYHDQAATGTATVTLPTATTLGNANFAFKYCNNSPQTDTITPATWSIQADNNAAASTLNVAPGVCYFISVDANSSTQWHASGSTVASASGANAALSNLSSVAINTALLPGAAGVDLGSTTKPFRNIFWYGSGTFATTYFEFIGTPTSTRQVTFQDASGTVPYLGTAQSWTALQTFGTNISIGNINLGTPTAVTLTNGTGLPGSGLTNNSVTATQLAAQYSKGSCTEAWGGTGTAFALTSGDDAVANNSCFNDSGVTRTITAVKCRSSAASNTTTVNPTFGSDGTGTTILSGALTCGSSYAYSSSGTVSNASWTTGAGIRPAMAGTLTGTSVSMIVEYTF